MFFLESKTLPGSLSFCCMTALEYRLSFSIQRNQMKFPLMMFGRAVMPIACMKKNGMMVLMKKFQLKKMMFWWSFCILLIHRPLEQQFTFKCWVSVNHLLQLLSIPTVNTLGRPYTFLKRECKDTQKQFTENLWTWRHSFMHLPIEICSSSSNSFIIIGNFWKHLT